MGIRSAARALLHRTPGNKCGLSDELTGGKDGNGEFPDHIARGTARTTGELVKGPVLGAGDPAYEESRRVFNAMIERRPAAIVRCSCAEDVARGVTAAREYDLPISVKGGGHSVAGNAVCEDGLMLDMSSMKRISVDPERGLAVAEAGLTLGEFDAATSQYGLATTLGVVSMTGIAGLTLGGGIGWLNGKHGLACDNVLSMDVVTADGQVRTVNADQHQDLFWAMRGGGGNFGVVVSFTYRLHPVDMVLAGPISYPPERAADALRLYHQVASTAPDSLATAASVARGADGRPVRVRGGLLVWTRRRG